ncbi:unnamed protein product [Adineta steineri]|uniref:Metallo-beta-lactamase domain-containing protein n=1 Tax=Adineta steineri TaxID=433720 RepID=A0A813YL52_9BILA|nr:unnamed protein product [Adineta steineri]CAF1164255.1 unnamed protein product [Adineta steineri]
MSSTPTVQVHAIYTGQCFLRNHMLFNDGDENESTPCPVWSFYIYHPVTQTHILFDLGLMKELDEYPPKIKEDFPRVFKPQVKEDVGDALKRHNISSSQIKTIIYSHPHFDHCGNPSLPHFQNATCLFGQGTQAYARPAYPINHESRFLESTFPEGRTQELTDKDYTLTLGPFEKVHDYFGDKSLLLIDAPGHMPGHQLALAKTGENTYLLLAGDSAHSTTHLQEYEGRMSYYMHSDKDAAKETLKKIAAMVKLYKDEHKNVRVCLAHAGHYEDFERII